MAGGGSLLTTFVISGFMCALFTTIFALVRDKHKWLYESRKDRRRRQEATTAPPDCPPGLLGWLHFSLTYDEEIIYQTAGTDAVLYQRFFWFAFKLFAIMTPLAAIILYPTNATGGNLASSSSSNSTNSTNSSGYDNIDLISISNIPKQSNLLWIHAIMAWVFSLLTYYFLYQLYIGYLALRQRHLMDNQAASRELSLLVQDVPLEFNSPNSFNSLWCSLFPHSVQSTVLTRDLVKLREVIDERNITVDALESTIIGHRNAREKARVEGKEEPDAPKMLLLTKCAKVDAVEHLGAEIERLNEQVAELQTAAAEAPYLGCGFVTFTSPADRTYAALSAPITKPFSWTISLAGSRSEVVWQNLSITFWQRQFRQLAGSAITFALVFLWIIPITAIGAIMSLQNLSNAAPWLNPIVNANPVVTSFIEGFLPSLLLIIFQVLLPVFINMICTFEGMVSATQLQLGLLSKLFYFQVFNFFLVGTISNGIFDSLNGLINNPTSIVSLLGTSLPKAGTSFSSYVLLNALSVFALQLLAIGPLIVGNILTKYVAVTPKDFYLAQSPPIEDMGRKYPLHLLIIVLGLSFSCISPIILPFCCLYFFLGYVTVRHHLIYVYPTTVQTGGQYFPLLFSRILVGLVVAQITILSLLGLKESSSAVITFPLPFITAIFYSYVDAFCYDKSLVLSIQNANAVQEERKNKKKQGGDTDNKKSDKNDLEEALIDGNDDEKQATVNYGSINVSPQSSSSSSSSLSSSDQNEAESPYKQTELLSKAGRRAFDGGDYGEIAFSSPGDSASGSSSSSSSDLNLNGNANVVNVEPSASAARRQDDEQKHKEERDIDMQEQGVKGKGKGGAGGDSEDVQSREAAVSISVNDKDDQAINKGNRRSSELTGVNVNATANANAGAGPSAVDAHAAKQGSANDLSRSEYDTS